MPEVVKFIYLWQIIRRMTSNIIGRKAEISSLNRVATSGRSEFVAIYGRRRVGKTYLVREFFDNNFSFKCTGLANSKTRAQLKNFNLALRRFAGKEIKQARTWLDSFEQLSDILDKSATKRKVVFLDELPWMDTARAGFIQALEHFWNEWASARRDIVLVVCGSSTSWMMDKLINNKGGLHNRLTNKILLKPFTLSECEQYFKSRKIVLSRYQIAEYYMIMGGIPYYLDYIEKGVPINQNIDKLFFDEGGQMRNEFDNLYSALFKNTELYLNVVRAINKKGQGLTRKELTTTLKIKSGSALTKVLKDLEKCGFIRSYLDFKSKTRNKVYQLTDPYTLFYYKFIDSQEYTDKHFWSNSLNTPERNTWAGLSFEILCLNHSDQILNALGISGVRTNITSWRGESAQIDMVIDRKDDCINLCEMKFSRKEFTIDKQYSEKLENKIESFIEETSTSKAILLTLITSKGLKINTYSDIAQCQVTLDDLFN